jgi:hypothetical protein
MVKSVILYVKSFELYVNAYVCDTFKFFGNNIITLSNLSVEFLQKIFKNLVLKGRVYLL